MIPIGDTIVSDELKRVQFHCDLKKCKGACCVAGDAGAPLQEEEISLLEDNLDEIKPYMTERGINAIREHGVFDYDQEGNFVTPLVNGAECAFTNFEKGIAYCSIERSFFEGRSKFRKPVSCHLYPVRIKKHDTFEAVNYHKWSVCKPALKLGGKKKLPLYIFLEEALTRHYGMDWYHKLTEEIEHS
jgi:hypothetical protein